MSATLMAQLAHVGVLRTFVGFLSSWSVTELESCCFKTSCRIPSDTYNHLFTMGRSSDLGGHFLYQLSLDQL